MKLYDYLDITKLEEQIAEGNVNRNFHKKFTNLAIYTYSKGCTMNYAWNEITCKCRGLIVDTSSWDIIARPFEKFFNVGEAMGLTRAQFPPTYPIITDKLDGNLITLYPWAGRWWAASKGSFHSEHADWANNWLFHNCVCNWPKGYTPVFEMIAEDLEHHVVHYGKEASGLYLIALVHNETGDELNDASRKVWANTNDIPYIPVLNINIEKALTDNEKNAEGYVLSWPRPGQTPVRVKVKFTDFLRLQKLVHHIGPKEILDYMSHPHLQCYLDEVLNPETSHPVFIEYVKHTQIALLSLAMAVRGSSRMAFEMAKAELGDAPRKAYAERFLTCGYPAVLFKMLDNDEVGVETAVWRQVAKLPMPEEFHGVVTQEE